MLALNIALAVIPALLLLRWAYRRDSVRPEPTRLVLRAFGLGIVALAIAVVVGLALQPFGRYFTGLSRLAFEAYFIAGFLEEIAKFAVVIFFVARHKEFDEVADGMVYAMAASLGFAVVENAMYLGGPASVLILRGLTAVPLHASVGGLMGYFIGVSRIESRGSALPGVLLAVAVHGTYDFVLFVGGPLSYLAILIVILSMASVARLFRRAVERDRAAGRLGPSQ